jgi:hypothetical protein
MLRLCIITIVYKLDMERLHRKVMRIRNRQNRRKEFYARRAARYVQLEKAGDLTSAGLDAHRDAATTERIIAGMKMELMQYSSMTAAEMIESVEKMAKTHKQTAECLSATAAELDRTMPPYEQREDSVDDDDESEADEPISYDDDDSDEEAMPSAAQEVSGGD